MKIIFASKFYYRRGGLESYYFKTKELLESRGHQIIPFSTNYSENYESEYSKYFCKYYDLSKTGRPNKIVNNIQATTNMFFNREAYQNMKKLIRETKPDLLQGFGVTKHLSHSIFKAAKEMGVPTIMRLSDYALLCPNSSATDGTGSICSDFACSKGNVSKAISKKCIQNSVLASIIGICEVKSHLMLNVYKKYVDYFIAPSRFIRNIFIEHFGISPQRIIFQPIFIESDEMPLNVTNDGYFLFAGRLSKEKGIYTLLEAFANNYKHKLIIAGRGPEEGKLKKFAVDHNCNAEFIGFQDYLSLQELIRRCCAVILPSEWYENSPNIVLEAYINGKPVIGSRVGGIPELIEDGKTGLLFDMGNEDDLKEKINYLGSNNHIVVEMQTNVKKIVEEKYGPDEHYDNLISIYNSTIKKKILLVNNYYYRRGGDCTYLFGLKSILESEGHNVVIFSMDHPQNKNSLWSKYFVGYINYDEEVKSIGITSGFKVATRTIFFLRAKKMIERIIKEEKPDIAHLQNIHHHITPSILYSLKKHSIPVVWTLHDYQLICSNISFLAHGKICERCKKHRYYWPPIIRCKKGSLAASFMSAIEITVHNIMGIDRLVSLYIAPSNFLRNKFIEYGFDENKIKKIPHFTDIMEQLADRSERDYFLFIGRISEEKGLRTLIDAAINVDVCKLVIVGSGPLLDKLVKYTNENDKNNIIEFVGHKDRDEVRNLLERTKFLVVPSEWYETSGLVILEAFACGKPVIASNIGGISELVDNKRNGLTFEMGNVQELSLKLEFMLNNPEDARKMGAEGKQLLECELNRKNHYREIIKIYDQVCH